MKKQLKIFISAAAIVALGAALVATSTESAVNADVVSFTAEAGSNPTKEEKPLTSEIPRFTEVSEESEGAEAPESTARYPLTAEERREIERIVASEGGYCEYEFQALVAECILNGCEADELRPLELFERGDYWLVHNVEPTETTKRAVSDVFDNGIMPTFEKIRYYYNPDYCVSAAHESKRYVLTHTGCRFFAD